MLVEHIESQRVNINRSVATLQKATCRTDILHNEMAHRAGYLDIDRRHHFGWIDVGQRYRQQIQCGLPVGGSGSAAGAC